MLKAKFIVVGGDPKQKEIPLKLPAIIGRGTDATLAVPYALISRRHTEIFEREGRLFVRDLGSLNGTFINNKRIDSEQPLDPDQLLTLGTVTFRAVYQIGDHELESDVQTERETESLQLSQTTKIESVPREVVKLASFAGPPLDSPLKETTDIDAIRPAAIAEEKPAATPPKFMYHETGSGAPKKAGAFIELDLENDSRIDSGDSELFGSFPNNHPR